MKQGVLDHASKEALKRQWNVLQVIWTEYLASNKSGTFDILRVNLASKTGETIHSLPNLLNGLGRDGKFEWREGAKNYRFSNIDSKKLETLYFEVKKSFENETSLTSTDSTSPSFDPVRCSINFKGKEIQIPQDSNQSGICKAVFKNKSSMNKLWNWDEIVEAWGDKPEPTYWRKVYNAARTINETIATKTTINDLLLITTKTIRVNPSYLTM